MKLKVCGMKYPKNIMAVAEISPDYLGFIFYDKSPRDFQEEIPQINPNIEKVGVFVDAPIDKILENISTFDLAAIQLHGSESVDFCKELKNKSRIKIIKVFSVDQDFQFEKLKPYEPYCDYFLFDTKGKLPGGNGFQFDWKILKSYSSSKPYFLSGGIGPDSISDLKDFMKLPASRLCHSIDINSKFEDKPGLKNIKKISEFKTQFQNEL